MIPLAMAPEGEKQKIKKISGNDRVRRHLQELGLVMDATVTVVSSENGNVIVGVGDTRVAIGADLALRVMV
ncbi:MAG: ferrous iron transport protein A [Kiritimatiellae bacterium]|nr:ferrous iron transport protein A [Kiritimatiellia bacterium]